MGSQHANDNKPEASYRKKEFYISPMGTLEEVSPGALEGDRDYTKDFKRWIPEWQQND